MTAETVLREIIRCCKKYRVKEAVLFGSRAKGTAHERSDFDIAVSGAEDIDGLSEDIDEIPTLYTIDLVDMDACRNRLLLEDIKKYGRKIYEEKAAFRAELISDDVWMEMLKVRNQLAHDYDGAIVKEYCQRIIGVYIDMLYEFCGKTGKLLQIG